MLPYRYTPLYRSSNGTLSAMPGKSYNMIPIKADNIDNLRKNLMNKSIHADRIMVYRKSGTLIGYMCFKGSKVYWTPNTEENHYELNKDGTRRKAV